MQSTDLEEIKAALWEQASHPCTQVRWGVAQVMGVKKSKGHLLVLLKGWSRWYAVDAVSIVRPVLCPTGGCDLLEEESRPGEWENQPLIPSAQSPAISVESPAELGVACVSHTPAS